MPRRGRAFPMIAGLMIGVVAAGRVACAQPAEVLAKRVLAEMVATNTTADAGSTTPLVRTLAARFRAAGWPSADVVVAGAGARTQNLVVRWRGRSSASPILFNAHLDVVEVERAGWTTDPFRLVERDGYLYGRGVLDDKGPAAAAVAAFLVARRSGVIPTHDLILTLIAGEESGVENGVEWLYEHRPELVRSDVVINLDAGGGDMRDGKLTTFAVQGAEKAYLDIMLVAKGPGGHSSVPVGLSPIDHLAAAVTRLATHRFPVVVSPFVRMFLERAGPNTPGALGKAMQAVAARPDDAEALQVLLADPPTAARLRTTCITTILRAGTAPNAIPAEATANVNCRVLPGETEAEVLRSITQVIADSNITLRVDMPLTPSPASTMPAWLESVLADALGPRFGTVPLVPFMETGATDGVYSRNRNIPTFGVAGLFVPEDDLARMHGNDERLPATALTDMAQYTERLVRAIASRP